MIAEGSLILREDTQDWKCYEDVFLNNEYRIGEFTSEDVVIDVGANIGCFAALALVRGAGKVVCFEPEPKNFDLLQRNLAPWGGRADCRRAAVWRSDEEGVIHLLDKEDFTATHHVCPTGDIEAPGVGLDRILREFGSVRLLKLDCEGSEYPALFTCTQLRRAEEIIGEYHLMPPRERPWDCSPEALKKYLEGYGFDVSLEENAEFPTVGHFFARRRQWGFGTS